MAVDNYEKLGVFYLGREYDTQSGEMAEAPLLYDTRDLTTHAVIVGMTGSGKTGLGITMLEEAGIDDIPAIIIDPKGDLGNLMLTFPNLQANEFAPWIDADEAKRKGQTVDQFAENTASTWRKGLADWDQPPERITRFRNHAEVAIYTPGSDAGRQLTVLKSLDRPSPAVMENGEALREQISSTVSGLLTLLGVDADPIRSHEHILVSNVIEQAWRGGRDLDLPQLIREIQSPPFNKIGVLDLESIIPTNDRRALAMKVNNLLASPSFATWTQGERLDISKLLHNKEGKAKLSIISIAHLNDQERMFFVTILLNEFISWMRSQAGTSSLRALLYMDEVFGYLPPTANPPSKLPMLTLLKQARAYGVGLILATQNPVDLDYKALSNMGTWFLGRLQTERDKARMLDGLEGASATAGVKFNRKMIETTLSGLKSRMFLMNNVHDSEPVVFQSRWALSYLRGPLTRDQIRTLSGPREATTQQDFTASSTVGGDTGYSAAAPILPPGVRQKFVNVAAGVFQKASIVYQPALLATGRLHYVEARSTIDEWQDFAQLFLIHDDSIPGDPWDDSEAVCVRNLRTGDASNGSQFVHVPADLQRAASFRSWGTACKNYLYRAKPLNLLRAPELKLQALPGEDEGEFRVRLAHSVRELRDAEVDKLRKKHDTAMTRVTDKIRKAEHRVEIEKQQASSATMSAAVQFGTSVLGALFGRKAMSASNATRAGSAIRSASKITDQRSDVRRANENLQAVQDEMRSLEQQIETEINAIKDRYSEDRLVVETRTIAPRKSDLTVNEIEVVWLPFALNAQGGLAPAFDQEIFTS